MNSTHMIPYLLIFKKKKKGCDHKLHEVSAIQNAKMKSKVLPSKNFYLFFCFLSVYYIPNTWNKIQNGILKFHYTKHTTITAHWMHYLKNIW